MSRPLFCALAALATSLSLLAVPGASPSTSAQRAASSLSIAPDVFVGGQSLTFEGTIADAPNAALKIETLFNRQGDSWDRRDGIVGRTNSQGQYEFTYPGPNNFGISYRVRADNGATSPAVVLEPRQQEVVLSLNGGPEQASGTVATGAPFTIDVDTTPTGRGTLGRPAPAFPGRTVFLQQRVRTDQWKTVDTTNSSDTGTARFVQSADTPGALAYRVVLVDITTGDNQIGWFPSHPLEISVLEPGVAAEPATDPTAVTAEPVAARSVSTSTAGATKASGTATPLASQRYQWGPSRFDFAWETGESLTDKPFRGTKRQGRWIDASDGSGRVAHYNGGMSLSTSVSEFPGDGDHGTTTATLKGNSMVYGRWEFRRRIDVFEDAGPDYRVKIDLVPARSRDDHCGANIINVADVSYNSGTAELGVSSARAHQQWSGSRPIPRLGNGPHSFAVEVTRRHITWFLDGKALATVAQRKAVPGVPLTPRLSLVGVKQDEMRRTRVLYDWQRGWPLNKQARKAETGRGLKSTRLHGGC